MASYQNAVVYAIRSHQTDQFYIGSTRTPMYKRLSKHRGNYKQWCNDNGRYVSSYEIVKYDDAYIELIEECPCENAAQLCKKEGEYIRLHRDNCVNVRVAGRPRQEMLKVYYEAHRNEILAKQRAYHEERKEECNAKRNAYNKAHKEERNAKQRERRAKAKAAKADAP